MTYYNTNGLTGEELVNARYKAHSQSSQLYYFFVNLLREGALVTPADLHKHFPMWPITSIRRAITDLTKLGVLEKTNERREGEYGQLNYCWKLRTEPEIKEQLDLFVNN